MGRGKVNFTLIENEAMRRASMKRRRQALIKKVSELTTLCGLSGMCMVYHPDEPQQPVVWPTHDGVREQLSRYFSIPEVERSKKTMTQETFLIERITKEMAVQVKLTKKVDDLVEAVLMDEVFYGRGLDGLHSNELDKLESLLKEKVVELEKKRESYEGGPIVHPQQQTQGDGDEFGLSQHQQTLNIDGGSRLGYRNHAQFSLQTGNQLPLVVHPITSAYDFLNMQQMVFGNTFIDSSYDMGQGSENYALEDENIGTLMAEGNLVPSMNHTVFQGGRNNFNLPPLTQSPAIHYHQQGSRLNPEPVVVDGGIDNDRIRYEGDQFVESVFEQGSSSANPRRLAHDQLQILQPQPQIEAYDNMGNHVWPPQAN